MGRIARWLLTGALATNALMAFQATSTLKVGTVHLQSALLKTKQGQAAAAELQRKATSREQGLHKLQSEITVLRDELNKLSSVGSADRKETLAREIEQKTKVFNRQLEDLQAELDQEQNRIRNDLGNRMLGTIQKFAGRGGYNLVIDVSAPLSPVLFASQGMDVTAEVVRMFDGASATVPEAASPNERKAPK